MMARLGFYFVGESYWTHQGACDRDQGGDGQPGVFSCVTSGWGSRSAPRPDGISRRFRWWQELCSVFTLHEGLESLAVTDSVMEPDATRVLPLALKHPHCKLRKLR